MAAPPISSAMAEILALLMQAWEARNTEVHGWLIMKSARRSGPRVYAALDRLETAGWITATWEVLPPGDRRPRRRFYRLTAEGAQAARQHLTAPEAPPTRRRGLQPKLSTLAYAHPSGQAG